MEVQTWAEEEIDAKERHEREVAEQRSELRAAGWSVVWEPYFWRSPNGELYLGPHAAWRIMKEGSDERR